MGEESFALHATITEAECKNCRMAFASSNRLHRHLRNDKCKKRARQKVTQPVSKVTQPASVAKPPIHQVKRLNHQVKQPVAAYTGIKNPGHVRELLVQLNITPIKENGLGFRQWHYVTASAKLSPNAELASVYLDSGCTITLVDRAFLLQQCSNA